MVEAVERLLRSSPLPARLARELTQDGVHDVAFSSGAAQPWHVGLLKLQPDLSSTTATCTRSCLSGRPRIDRRLLDYLAARGLAKQRTFCSKRSFLRDAGYALAARPELAPKHR